MKFKVTLHLMVDPSVNEKTFSHSYIVECDHIKQAYDKAEQERDTDVANISSRSVFSYDVEVHND